MFHADLPKTQAPSIRAALAFGEALFALGVASACLDRGIVLVSEHYIAESLSSPHRDFEGVVLVGDPTTLPPAAIREAAASGLGIVIVAREIDVGCVRRCVAAGARGYMPTSVETAAMIDGIRSVAAGGFALASESQCALATREIERADRLSARELEVLQLMARDLTARQIGAELYVAEATVKTHIKNLGGKLGVRRRAGIVLRAQRLGLLSEAASVPL